MARVADQTDAPGSSRRDTHPPLPRDKRGWQVAPALDGRGMPEQPPTGPPPHRRPRLLIFIVVLLAVNWLSVLVFQPGGKERVTIPFSPVFLEQVNAGNVKS